MPGHPGVYLTSGFPELNAACKIAVVHPPSVPTMTDGPTAFGLAPSGRGPTDRHRLRHDPVAIGDALRSRLTCFLDWSG